MRRRPNIGRTYKPLAHCEIIALERVDPEQVVTIRALSRWQRSCRITGISDAFVSYDGREASFCCTSVDGAKRYIARLSVTAGVLVFSEVRDQRRGLRAVR